MKYEQGRQWNKTLLALLALAIVVVLPIGIFITATSQKTASEQRVSDVRHEISTEASTDPMLDDFRSLKAQINDPNMDTTLVEESLNKFVALYGDQTAEAKELNEAFVTRKNAEMQAAKINKAFISEVTEIKALIQDPKRSLNYLETVLFEFIANYGGERREVRELRRLLAERKKLEEESALREKTIVEEAKTLIARIHDGDEDISALQSAVSEFIVNYGEGRKEVPELRRILEGRKKLGDERFLLEQPIAREAKLLAARIKKEDESIEQIDSALSEFIIQYGEGRKEIPELRRLINKRKDRERRKLNLVKDMRELMKRIENPNYSIHNIEQLINEFIDNYGKDREEVSELNRLLSQRREKENYEKEVAETVALLQNQISDGSYPIEDASEAFYEFIAKYGENRTEIPELRYHLEERKKAELEKDILSEAQVLLAQMEDREISIDSLQSRLDQFISAYGDDRNEIPELKRVLDTRRYEQTIFEVLSSLDRSVLEGQLENIRFIVADQEYAERLVALTEWRGLIFRHHIESFRRDSNMSIVEIRIRHAVEHMPERDLYYRYHLAETEGGWVIETSEKLENRSR